MKERKVYWFLFPLIGLLSGILLFQNTEKAIVISTILINFLYVSFLLCVILLYAKLKLKTSFTNVFGIGDLLLFLALTLTFSSISFIILLVFSLIFSLIIHLIFKEQKKLTVPLAGYMSLFFAITYITHWLGFLPTLYYI